MSALITIMLQKETQSAVVCTLPLQKITRVDVFGNLTAQLRTAISQHVKSSAQLQKSVSLLRKLPAEVRKSISRLLPPPAQTVKLPVEVLPVVEQSVPVLSQLVPLVSETVPLDLYSFLSDLQMQPVPYLPVPYRRSGWSGSCLERVMPYTNKIKLFAFSFRVGIKMLKVIISLGKLDDLVLHLLSFFYSSLSINLKIVSS